MTQALYPGEDVYPSETLYPQDEPALTLPSATTLPRSSRVRILYGELRTGRITGELPCTGASWGQTLNEAGYIDRVTVADDDVRRLDLAHDAEAARCFLAVEVDDRIQEAGPIWSDPYNWETGKLTLGASGLWSLFDHRKVLPILAAGQKAHEVTTTISGTDYGGIGRDLVAQALSHVGGDLPLVLPGRPAGTRTETFPGYQLLWLGEQLRQLTRRETAAPDIAFAPRRNPTDRRFLQWVMQVGTEAAPALSQTGADWVFDTTARRSPVLGISTDGDAHRIGSRSWVTGSGHEKDMLIATDYDPALIDRGLPLLEQEEPRESVEVQATLDGHARNLLRRASRRSRVWKVTVHAAAAAEVRAGDYASVVVAGHPVLGSGETRLRVRKKSGDLTDRVVLDMYPVEVPLA
jgi:hypothetical protein